MKLSRRSLLAGALGLPLVGLFGRPKAEPFSGFSIVHADVGTVFLSQTEQASMQTNTASVWSSTFTSSYLPANVRVTEMHVRDLREGTNAFDYYYGKIKPYVPASLNRRDVT